ncbi:MAG: sulfatase [Phycisphaerales bacterium]|nr:MAG: sulfatase [Phycisphaerales bacterium]
MKQERKAMGKGDYTRRDFLKQSLAVGATAFVLSNRTLKVKVGPKHPNFIVFLTDDQGYGDLGCYGHPLLKTPNIDRFATEGMKFTDCHAACPVCSPSRSAILTGRTPYRNGVYTWIPANTDKPYLRESEITVARLLKQKGYATCHVGKWHLNGKFNSPEQPQPDDHGYDWWFATQNNASPSHKNPTNFVRNGRPVGPLEGYSALLTVDEAIRWLRNHRDPDKPFFISVWTHEPHKPIESDPRFMELYSELDDADLRQHHGNISQIDFAFGQMCTALDQMQMADNTFIFYTSDNGPEGNGTTGRTRGSTGGLRGRKRSVYEGGIRVPTIVRWPGYIKPGSVCNQPAVGSDVFTTICDVVGIPVPADRTIDGASLAPAFSGKSIERKVPLYWRYHGSRDGVNIAMRQGDWKILAPTDLSRFELYNLKEDLAESQNLAADEPQRLEEMKKTLIELNAQIEAEGPDWWK